MGETITLNALPIRIWERLGVNEARFPWDPAQAEELPAEIHVGTPTAPLRLSARGPAGYARKELSVETRPGEEVLVLADLRTEGTLLVHTELSVAAGATVRLVQLVRPETAGSRLASQVTARCADGGRVELVQVLLGRGDVWCEDKVALDGAGSSLAADLGYLGQAKQQRDIGLVVDHYGRETKSEIHAGGALRDAAEKTFRGTIDFKRGASGAVGSELETVLMLGEDAVNKTVPVILCAEEDIVGEHGASIGALDEETLFYFESRGIGRAQAEELLARAAIERLARRAGDEEMAQTILDALEEELSHEGLS